MASNQPIPEKRYLNIGEVAKIVDVAPHVLRYWEKEFPQVRPVKRAGNRRFYRPRDVDVLLQIRHLLYERRFTISGAREHLRQKENRDPGEVLREVRAELKDLHRMLTSGSEAASGASPDGPPGVSENHPRRGGPNGPGPGGHGDHRHGDGHGDHGPGDHDSDGPDGHGDPDDPHASADAEEADPRSDRAAAAPFPGEA